MDQESKGTNEFYSLDALCRQGCYIGPGDALEIEVLNKIPGARVSSVDIALADTTTLLLLVESSVEFVQSSNSSRR